MHLGKEQLEKSGAEVAFTIDRMLLPLEHADGKLSISQALARSRESPYKGNSDLTHKQDSIEEISWLLLPTGIKDCQITDANDANTLIVTEIDLRALNYL